MKHFLIPLIAFVTIISCSTDSVDVEDVEQDFTAENEAQIQAYLTANNLSSTKTATGLHYIIENEGTGAQPTASSTVTVAYKGYFLDGTVFDQSNEDGIRIGLNQVIKGWTEGIPKFKVGGSGVLLIPAHLGYGSFNRNGIPGGSVLVFDVSLLAVD